MLKKPSAMTSAEKRRLKRKRRIKRRKTVLIIILLLGAAIGILFTPLFNLREVVIEGNDKITVEEIIKKGELVTGKNLFTFNLNKTGEKISSIPYVNSLFIKRKLPDKIVIRMTESIPMAYVISDKGYVVIDKTGKALEVCETTETYEIPLLKDVKAEKFTLSQKIIVNNQEKFKKTLEILRDLYNNSFIREVLSIDTTEEDIILNISDDLTVDMGGYDRFNAKTVMVKEIVAQLPEGAVGRIDASNPDKVYYDKTPPVTETEEETVSEEPGTGDEEVQPAEGTQNAEDQGGGETSE